mgnify:CR=1 FL=1
MRDQKKETMMLEREFGYPTVSQSTYQESTDPIHLTANEEIRRRCETNHRRRQIGCIPTRPAAVTITPQLLPTQFIDPNKQRYKTVYQKSYNRPETTTATTRSVLTVTAPRVHQQVTESSWRPGWH